MSKINIEEILKLVNEELSVREKEPRKEEHDHEGRMARSEMRDLLVNGMKLYKMIGPDDELPGWVSAYITLASDYIHSVTEYMVQDKIDNE